jgi:hypothetical protein
MQYACMYIPSFSCLIMACAIVLIKLLLLSKLPWFQTHCFSENLEEQGIEPGTSGSVARNYDH